MVNSKNKISTYISSKLKGQGDAEFAKTRSRLVKDKSPSFGVKMGKIREVVKDLYRDIPELQDKKRCTKIARELMATEIFENQLAGIFLLKVLVEKKEFEKVSFLRTLILRYIDNWAICDTISTEIVAKIIIKYPDEMQNLLTWTKSRSVWLKRAAIVAIIKSKSRIENWEVVSDRVLFDLENEKEDIVKKAIKWLKKEVS